MVRRPDKIEVRSVAVCPKCGAAGNVYDMRHAPGVVRRRRACPSCGWRWNTTETADLAVKPLRFAAQQPWPDATIVLGCLGRGGRD